MSASAQTGDMEPVLGVRMARVVSLIQIEEATYQDVLVELKSAGLGAVFMKGVRLRVWDTASGKEIYKKRFSNAYLYVDSNGTIKIADKNALMYTLLFESEDEWVMKVKEDGFSTYTK